MNSRSKIRVALLGCGQIADAHLSQIQRIRFAEPVAVCDVHEDLAYQAAARFNIPGTYTDLDRMIAETEPDVVHLTTPAQTHAPLAIRILERGCHVYVEKPFAVDGSQAQEILDAAARFGRQVCVGHDQLFDPLWLKGKEWLDRGELGDLRFVESILGYPIDGNFGAAVKADRQHWVRQLPGGLFQNTISHPLYRITDLIPDPDPELIGGWHIRRGFEFPTELNMLLESEAVSGQLIFSTHLPPQRITRLYGTQATLELDFDAQTMRLCPIPRLPGAFAKLEAPWKQFRNSLWNLTHNIGRFATADIHYFAGMKSLFERFYLTILQGDEPPITPMEVLHITRLMDRIFEHCQDRPLTQDADRSRLIPNLEDASCLVSHV